LFRFITTAITLEYRLDGLSTVKEIAQRAQDLNISAIGLTDHDVVSGHIDFYRAMRNSDIKPLLGVETYQASASRLVNAGSLNEKGTKNKIENFHLILLAQSNTGLKNLWRMNTEAHRSGFYYNGRVDWDLLSKFNEGIICTSACASGLLSSYIRQEKDYEEILKKYISIFGDRFYIELSTYSGDFQKDINKELVSLSKRWGIPTVYGNDAHYAFPEQYDLHEAILAVQYNQKLSELKEPHHEPCLYIMDEDDVRKHLSYLDDSIVNDAIANTVLIADSCNVELPAIKDRTPAFIPDKKWQNSWDMFFDLVKDGYQEKVVDKGKHSEIYFERLQKELSVIKNANLYDYFLIVRDYIENARKQGIVTGPGRGSIGGSLVAYLVGITSIDSVQYGLIFERFYNKGRVKSKPDIDTDFSTKGRDKVKSYVSNKYGAKYVSDLGTTIGLKSKGAINDVGRVLGIPIPEVRAIASIIDRTIVAGIQADWDTINDEVGKDLAPYRQKYPQMFEWAERLFDHIRGYGVHASGVIIGDDELDGIFPMRWVTKDKKLVTQWPMEIAEEFGYMKMDFLGLRTLDTLEEVNSILKESGKEVIDYDSLHDMEFPEEMWTLLDKGLSVGLFQIEDGIAKGLVKKMKCRNIEDLIDFLALNRPGPDVEAYMNGRNGGMVTYANPLIENVTRSTYGMFLFQEQIIEFMQQLGYSLDQADNFRSVMGKKKVSEINKEKDLFFSKSKDFMSDDQAYKIWHMIENFSKYGFNKSHAVGYAIILLCTLYAKWAYPAEFILAGIRTVDKPQIKRFLGEARRMGINVYPPDINESENKTIIKNDAIRFGFSDIKYFSDTSARWILQNRPFTSMDDLLEKIQEKKIILPNGVRRVVLTSKHIDILTKIGALNNVEGVEITIDEDERILAEEEYIGIAFSDKTARILEQYGDEITDHCTAISAIEDPGMYLIAGAIFKIEEKITKTGKEYIKIYIRDIEDQEIEIFVWNNERERFQFMWRRNVVGIFSIKKTEMGFTLKDAKTLFDKESR
jgi:DNA polymerase-3 subunit alpha